jgi:WD40 repeat protein
MLRQHEFAASDIKSVKRSSIESPIRTSATQNTTPTPPPAGPLQPSTRMTEEAGRLIIRSSTPVRAFDNVDEVTAVAVSSDRHMATTSPDGILRMWDLKNGVLLKELEGRGPRMGCIALSRDGKLMASCDYEGYITAWDVDTGRRLTQPFRPHESHSCLLDFSPDGTTLTTASDRMTKLWRTETWQAQGMPIDCSCSVNCVRYSPSGELLAIATQLHYPYNQSISIWNPATRQRIANVGEPGESSVSLVWTPDGTRLLSMSNPTIREWDSSSRKQVSELWTGQTGSCIAVNCSGTLVAYYTGNRVRVRRLSDGRTIAIFQHSDSPHCITFSTDGKHVLVGGKDKRVSQWAVPEYAALDDAPKDQATHLVCSHSFPIRHLISLMSRFKTVMQRLKALRIRHVFTLQSYTVMRA